MSTANSLYTRGNTPLSTCVVTVVVPAYNEEDVLPAFHRRLLTVLESIPARFEVIYVDDGSHDATPQILQQFHERNPAIGIAHFSRNFGKEQAVSAGLNLSRGDCVIVIDADLQDPPELIPSMIDAWHQGADVVNMCRRSREGETWADCSSKASVARSISSRTTNLLPQLHDRMWTTI